MGGPSHRGRLHCMPPRNQRRGVVTRQVGPVCQRSLSRPLLPIFQFRIPLDSRFSLDALARRPSRLSSSPPNRRRPQSSPPPLGHRVRSCGSRRLPLPPPWMKTCRLAWRLLRREGPQRLLVLSWSRHSPPQQCTKISSTGCKNSSEFRFPIVVGLQSGFEPSFVQPPVWDLFYCGVGMN